jgi:predicted RNase H-like HicB family nuclease
MSHPLVEYVYIVERSEDGSYWAYVPDLWGCATTAETLEDIPPMMSEAVQLYLSYFRDRNEPLPPARTRSGVVVTYQ